MAKGQTATTSSTGSGKSQTNAQDLRKPGFASAPPHIPTRVKAERKSPAREIQKDGVLSDISISDDEGPSRTSRKRKLHNDESDDDYDPSTDKPRTSTSGSRKLTKSRASSVDYSPESDTEESDDDWYVGEDVAKKPTKRGAKSKSTTTKSDNADRLDDGDERIYQARITEWSRARRALREEQDRKTGREPLHRPDLPEYQQPHPTEPDLSFDDKGFKLPGDIHPVLFDYQKVGCEWLWQLHCEGVGGILGDEMGLGKTIQVVSHIAGLHYSGMLDKPVLIVATGTLMRQWAREFHDWWPALRVSILHKSGSGMLHDKDSEDPLMDGHDGVGRKPSPAAARKIVSRVFRDGMWSLEAKIKVLHTWLSLTYKQGTF